VIEELKAQLFDVCMAKEDHDKLTTQLKIQVEGFKKNAFDRVQE
jgi:hypothetical protein